MLKRGRRQGVTLPLAVFDQLGEAVGHEHKRPMNVARLQSLRARSKVEVATSITGNFAATLVVTRVAARDGLGPPFRHRVTKDEHGGYG